MSVQEAIQTLEEERFKFSLHLKKKRLKPRMLAPIIGKSESYVRQLLSGKRTEPTFSTMEKIADALDVSLDEFRSKEEVE